MKALLAFRRLFMRQAHGFGLALILSLVTLAAGIALLGTSGWFITAAALTTAGLAFNLFVPSSLVRGFSFIRILARYGERLSGHDATLRLLADLRGWLFSRLFPRLPLRDRSLRHGDLVSRLTADIDALDTAFLVAIGPILAALLTGAALAALLGWLLPAAALPYGLAFAAATLAVPAALVFLGRRAGSDAVRQAAEARAGVLDGIDGHADLVLLGVLGTAQTGFATTTRRLARTRAHLAGLTSLAGLAVQGLAALALAAALWAGLLALEAKTIEGPVLAGLILAIIGSFEATGVIVRSVGKLTTAMAAAERLTALSELPPTLVDPPRPQPWPDDTTISFSAVSFRYDGPPVLDGLDLTVAPGEHLAITGSSGAGKSSLLALLLRLHEPQHGRITIGGVPIAQMKEADLHAGVALLGQDSPLFNDTIRANLLIARPAADDAALWQALAAAGIVDFVKTLPRGLDALLGEGGRTVSAGQARRLCLARVLLSAAPILLLDEPTAGLDRPAEIAFFETLHQAAAGRTVLIVTHAGIPPGTVDRRLALENGRLA
ncbi:thiol reductant ABC exporter subunit CydC [Devosia sp.]|uniref:thiol reductant ABC exporter subunit CydC n=1 Tax=Devosia sp. TaxID=1871048 RepID=UPI002AFF4684|nr:thiol reductant ABC exporter subunit CydC [Devosia sp.]